MMLRGFPPLRLALLTAAALLLSGCATSSPERALADVRAITALQVGTIQTPADEQKRQHTVAEILAAPLSHDAAVRLALLNNRGIQANLAELGIAQADLAQASWLANPSFGFARKRRGGEVEIERSFGIDILGVLTLPWRSEIEARYAERSKLQVAQSILRTALQTRIAWVDAVAAAQIAEQLALVAESAQTSAELARRMWVAGGGTKLNWQRVQLDAAEAKAQSVRAKQSALENREALIRLLALAGPDAAALQLPSNLPPLPTAASSLPSIGANASDTRLDLYLAQAEVAALAKSLGLTKATRWINVLEASYLNNSRNDGASQYGYALSFELPLFDWSGAKVAKAEAIYRQALHRATEIAINAESEMRSSYAEYLSRFELARYYRDDVFPLRQAITDEQKLRYNGMLASVFDLISERRDHVNSLIASIEAERSFWIAEANLEMAVRAGSPFGQIDNADPSTPRRSKAGH